MGLPPPSWASIHPFRKKPARRAIRIHVSPVATTTESIHIVGTLRGKYFGKMGGALLAFQSLAAIDHPDDTRSPVARENNSLSTS